MTIPIGDVLGIIYDFDGTLKRSHIENWNALRYGFYEVRPNAPQGEDAPPIVKSLSYYLQVCWESENWIQIWSRTGFTEDEIQQGASCFGEYFEKNTVAMNPYEHVPEMVLGLSSFPQGIVSQNSSLNIRNFLSANDLSHLIKKIIGFQEAANFQKPDPQALIMCIDELGLYGPGIIPYVGDHWGDMQMVDNANQILDEIGIKIIKVAALYGLKTREFEIKPEDYANFGVEPDIWLNDPLELLTHVVNIGGDRYIIKEGIVVQKGQIY